MNKNIIQTPIKTLYTITDYESRVDICSGSLNYGDLRKRFENSIIAIENLECKVNNFHTVAIEM